MIEIPTKIANLRLKNPTILASGIMDEDAGSMIRIFKSGAGAIVTKSIGLKPREGYPNPSVIELECGLLNAMGLPNPGIEEFKSEVIKLKKSKVTVIGSIFGSNSKEFTVLGTKMQDAGVNALELNMSCPHAKGYGLEIGSDQKIVEKITTNVKSSVSIPVFVKISPNLTDIPKIAQSAEKGGADAIVAINTVKAMKIDIETQRPILSNKIGGYSGKAIKPIGIRCVYEIYKKVNIPIIGVGGINTGEDAIEYMMAGASAVQIGSAIYSRDIYVFEKICKEIKNWMKTNNYKKIDELIGVANL
ncbi:MAG: dihydroorotate dehydrogenase [Candidatus Thermoplasmatota archaeon]|nr:dihydroorotate dehydrogenase [Candidatus Thermoplasmatota archaeon]